MLSSRVTAEKYQILKKFVMGPKSSIKQIPIAIILKQPSTLATEISKVEKALQGIGIQVVTSGKATLSGRLSLTRFKKLFGIVPIELKSSPPGDNDMGAPGGFQCEQSLKIPRELRPFVRHISIVPPARRLMY